MLFERSFTVRYVLFFPIDNRTHVTDLTFRSQIRKFETYKLYIPIGGLMVSCKFHISRIKSVDRARYSYIFEDEVT